jgi:desumoylating isopeptidase 1
MSNSVQLVIYDLSHGMARQLSAQFLGGPQYAIDIIPHTALVVFGREYFFGGGIQHEDPHQFRRMTGMYPIQTLHLGTTLASRAEFEAWCASAARNGRYTAASYDLLERNCNNFSHDAALEGLRLSQGVPEWILQVPQKFLSSPMGQMVRPILQNMQVSGGSGNSAPFSSTPTSSFSGASSMVTSTASSPSQGNNSQLSDEPKAGTPTLDTFSKPLISKDSKTVLLCVKKLVTGLADPDDQQTLQEIGKCLASNSKISGAQLDRAFDIISQNLLPLEENKNEDKLAVPVTFVLMFLRVLVLQAEGSKRGESPLFRCIDWICQQLQEAKESSHVSATASRTMAYLVLANAASVPGLYEIPTDMLESTLLTDWALTTQSRPEVRQAAAALAYNYVLSAAPAKEDCDGSISDQMVSLLCASMEGLEAETDSTTRLRRILVAGRILRPVECNTNETVQSLLTELGFLDTLHNLAEKNSGDKESRSLAKELLSLLNG